MALPKLEAARYTLKLPVSGEKVSFRPYLVKEQKILLQAFELKNADLVATALDDILHTVTKEPIDDKPLADIEFLMLNLRGKSSGENIELKYKCNNIVDKIKLTDKKEPVLDEAGNPEYEKGQCGAQVPYDLNIADVKVKITPDREDKIMVSKNIGIKLKDISYGDFKKLKSDDVSKTIENNLKLLTKYIDAIFDEDKVYTDFTETELLEFIDQLEMHHLEKIQEFIEKAPKLEHVLELTCPKCCKKETITLSGLDDFLT